MDKKANKQKRLQIMLAIENINERECEPCIKSTTLKTRDCSTCKFAKEMKCYGDQLMELTNEYREGKNDMASKIQEIEKKITPEKYLELKKTMTVKEIAAQLDVDVKALDNWVSKHKLRGQQPQIKKEKASKKEMPVVSKAEPKAQGFVTISKVEYEQLKKERAEAIQTLDKEYDKNQLLNDLLKEQESSKCTIIKPEIEANTAALTDEYETFLLKRILQLKGAI